MLKEDFENVFKRHNRLARATRAAIEAMNLTMVAPDSPADSATGCFVPEGLDGGKLAKSMRNDFSVTLAGGQDQGVAATQEILLEGY